MKRLTTCLTGNGHHTLEGLVSNMAEWCVEEGEKLRYMSSRRYLSGDELKSKLDNLKHFAEIVRARAVLGERGFRRAGSPNKAVRVMQTEELDSRIDRLKASRPR